MARYVAERELMWRPPGEGYDRRFAQGEIIEIPDDYKGRPAIGRDRKPEVDKDGKPVILGIPKHFRKLKSRERAPEEEEVELSEEAFDRALSGEPTSLSELGPKPSVNLDGSKEKKQK